MELNKLVGTHELTGVDFNNDSLNAFEADYHGGNVINFVLDGITYTAVEDYEDSYRSSMRDILVSDFKVANSFAPVKVVAAMRSDYDGGSYDILDFTDVESGLVVLSVGTDYSDSYYPSFINTWLPANLNVNKTTQVGYLDNTIHWPRGSVVIHRHDAKEPKMLMRVIGYTRKGGLAKCQYIGHWHRRTIYLNDIKHLLDPRDFDINPEWGDYTQDKLAECQTEFLLVRNWNRQYKVGQHVYNCATDGEFVSTTTAAAYQHRGGDAYISLKDRGQWLLRFITAIDEDISCLLQNRSKY